MLQLTLARHRLIHRAELLRVGEVDWQPDRRVVSAMARPVPAKARLDIVGVPDVKKPKTRSRVDLLQDTFDLLILRTLLFGANHGHAIAKHIQRTPVFCLIEATSNAREACAAASNAAHRATTTQAVILIISKWARGSRRRVAVQTTLG